MMATLRLLAATIVAALFLLTAGGCGLLSDSELDDLSVDGDRDPESPASFQVNGADAIMVGVIGPTTPDRVEALIDDHPDVTRIVLLQVPGSEDDQSNLEASAMVNDAGLDTHVPAEGEIASGGVDFFLAGRSRTWDPGARFGVHSWSTGEDGFNAVDLDRDDPGHDLYLGYYDDIGIDPEFYWFTLQAAPPESIHFMTEAELERFDFAR